jgi:superfamily I DNA/RNA helicase
VQDVLIYNLFSSSPLRNKWRVIYGYIKENGTVALPKEIAYPEFDGNKHFLLCSELKLLYVAVTRTRQRLWICEDKNDLYHPIFDYWKMLCLVQVRQLDSLCSEEMQKQSSTEDWRLRGIKVSTFV